jgi:DNA end-binding protein Ku
VTGEDDPVEKDEIVKGYEYSKGEYVMIEPDDIENLRIPSRQIFAVEQFVNQDDLDPMYFEKPYFVAPDSPSQVEAFAVVRKAMQLTAKVALGKIAFGGREHLIALVAPEGDDELGMMAYTMRYAEELRNPSEYFGSIKKIAIDKDQLSLAKELIERKVSAFDPSKYSDDYETALRAMVEAKIKHAPIPKHAPAPKPTNVINLMDALRKSVEGNIKASRAVKAGDKVRGKKLNFPGGTTSTSSRKPKTRVERGNSKRKSA